MKLKELIKLLEHVAGGHGYSDGNLPVQVSPIRGVKFKDILGVDIRVDESGERKAVIIYERKPPIAQ